LVAHYFSHDYLAYLENYFEKVPASVNLLPRFCSQRNEGTRQRGENGAGAEDEAVNETRIIARIKQGDKKAFAEFVDAYGAKIHRLARRYASLPADAEDLTQEIFLELYRGMGGFRGESALSTWVYRVAVNRCLRYCQRERKADDMELNEDTQAPADWRTDPAQFAANRELGEQVQDALHCLSPGHQDVVVLCEMHGLTYKECADALNIPVGTVKSRLSNAFRKMRVILNGYVNDACAADGPAILERIP